MSNSRSFGMLPTIAVLVVTVTITLLWQPYSARSKYHGGYGSGTDYLPLARTFLRDALNGDSTAMIPQASSDSVVRWMIGLAHHDSTELARALPTLAFVSQRVHGDTVSISFNAAGGSCEAPAFTLDYLERGDRRVVLGGAPGCGVPQQAVLP